MTVRSTRERVRSRLRGAGVALSLLVVVVMTMTGLVAGAAEPLKPADLSASDSAIALARSEHELDEVNTELRDVVTEVFTTQASLNVTLGSIDHTKAERADVLKLLRLQGVEAYRRSGSMASAALTLDAANEVGSARQYAGAAATVDASEVTRLNETLDRLGDEQARRQQDRDDAVGRRDALDTRREELIATVEAHRARLAAAGVVPVMGQAVLNAGQIAGWYAASGATPQLAPGTTIADVASLYLEEGAAENVRGDFAFAQAIIETGSFAVAAGNNYSGIGVCDSCRGGYGFPTPRDGVRAQIQLLKNYADPDSRAATLSHPPSPGLYGADPQKAARLYDTFFLKGKAPLWNLMGGGNWATDPVYAPKVVKVYNQIVAFANAHPELA